MTDVLYIVVRCFLTLASVSAGVLFFVKEEELTALAILSTSLAVFLVTLRIERIQETLRSIDYKATDLADESMKTSNNRFEASSGSRATEQLNRSVR